MISTNKISEKQPRQNYWTMETHFHLLFGFIFGQLNTDKRVHLHDLAKNTHIRSTRSCPLLDINISMWNWVGI